MFLPIPFHSYFLKKFSRSDDESFVEDFDALDEFDYTKNLYEVDLSSTHDETDVSSLIWRDSDENRKKLTLEEAELYTNFLDSESMAEPIRLLPFLSIHLHERRDQFSSTASTTYTADDKDEKHNGASNIMKTTILKYGGE